jgi:hypothetical protein
MIVDVPRKGVAEIWCDEPDARLETGADIRLSVATEVPARQASSARAVVEILRRFSGHPQRALVGGQLISDDGDSTLVVVNVSADHMPRRACRGPLSRLSLVVGMPELFATGVAAGLSTTVDGVCPPGTLTVDRGGWHEIDSSKKGFEQAAMVLGLVLIAKLAGGSVETAARAAIDRW